MPVSRATAENLARAVAEQYAEAERLMLARIAKNLAKGIDGSGPHWYVEKLAQMREYRRQTRALIADLEKRTASGVQTALTEAYDRGGLSAVADMAQFGIARPVEPLAGLSAVERLSRETLGYLNATHARILRSTMDAYRSIIADASQQVLLGTVTRRQAAQSALNRFAQQGITGFVDKAGKAWNLASYTEMATRAGTMQAAVQGHTDTMQANGLDLVIVSEDGSPCPDCEEWEGMVLSISGNSPGADDTVDSAMGAGLFHPGCKHTLSAYQEGITQPYPEKTASDVAAEAQGYKDGQKLRYLERQTRAVKRVQAAAMDEQAKQLAGAKVRTCQAKIREHVANTSAVRQPVRERLGAL